MRFARWITKAADTFRVRNTYCFSMTTMVARTGLNVVFIQGEVYTPRGPQSAVFTVTAKLKHVPHFICRRSFVISCTFSAAHRDRRL